MTDAPGVVSSIYQSGKAYDLLYPGGASAPAFWQDLAQTYGDPVLEIMSGTGSIAIPLAQAGYDVTGVEMAEPMLAEARRKSAAAGVAVAWVLADARAFDFPQELDALLWYNGFAIERKEDEDGRPFDAQSGMQYYVLKLRD